MSLYKRTKLFNAVIQLDHDKFHDVAIFASEKQMSFKQAEKNRSPVKLDKIKRRVSSQGEGFDVQCGKRTEISVVGRLPFPFKHPREIVSRSVAEVKSMAPKQPALIQKPESPSQQQCKWKAWIQNKEQRKAWVSKKQWVM
ncbi:hypothetical protein ROHU_010451 [Labeo rohita]|uniref:Uncharacterized protein n=1 Tax=Labeo rohita TaxID=84645 RepID=A0A498LSA2_LABRO|nr:hypothetical protein ROHU_011569 [Labeo rohita]RXN11845.1 hypothetical protein ROHU_010451 [Labeo rohita]